METSVFECFDCGQIFKTLEEAQQHDNNYQDDSEITWDKLKHFYKLKEEKNVIEFKRARKKGKQMKITQIYDYQRKPKSKASNLRSIKSIKKRSKLFK